MTYCLNYILDPMCSWCWAFKPTWQKVKSELPDTIKIRHLVGGLAPDSDQPMPESMRTMLQSTWQRIEQTVPGTKFNFDFWTDCEPRRSTYPSCRAVLAAREQDSALEESMITAIQHAYYLEAKNPSNTDTLIELASKIGCDRDKFATDLASDALNRKLFEEFAFVQQLGVTGFPSLTLSTDHQQHYPIRADYNNPDTIVHQVLSVSGQSG